MAPDGVATLWPGTWVPAIAIVMLCIAGWEVFWRAQDFEPSLSDDAMLWSIARQEATDQGTGAAVLVGSSRMQMGIHRETLAAQTGWEPAVQLALVRGPSIPVLRHLAADPNFVGTVLCEISLPLFFGQTEGFVREVEQYISVYDNRSLVQRLEQRLAMEMQGNFVSKLSRLSPKVIRNAVLFQQMPTPRYEGVIGEDRYRYADYGKVANIGALHRRIAGQLAKSAPAQATPGMLEQRFAEVEDMVAAIKSRGGDVIFVRLPSYAMVLEREREWFPRDKWWDVFAAQTQAQTIHYLDDPILAEILPPDGDHLGKNQAVKFSRQLGRLLTERGLAPGASE
ncbi:MAG: hypothetical protein ACI8W3_002640 [Myxococcota bacterium]